MTRACVVYGLLLGLAVACGDDDEMSPPGDGGADASTDASVSGGTGGSAGVTTSGGTGGGVTPIQPTPAIMCGDTTCPRPPGQEVIDLLGSAGLPVSGGGFFQACCTEDDACGLVVNSVGTDGGLTSAECVPRPESDPRCPDRLLLGVNQPGCCLEDTGMCGVNTAQVGGSCEDYSAGLAGVLLAFQAIPCEGVDGGMSGDDGGTSP